MKARADALMRSKDWSRFGHLSFGPTFEGNFTGLGQASRAGLCFDSSHLFGVLSFMDGGGVLVARVFQSFLNGVGNAIHEIVVIFIIILGKKIVLVVIRHS